MLCRLSRELLARFGPGAGEGECRNTEDKYRTLLDIGGHVGWYSLLVAAAGHRSIVLEPMRYKCRDGQNNRDNFACDIVRSETHPNRKADKDIT